MYQGKNKIWQGGANYMYTALEKPSLLPTFYVA
jgi:hypothetical protein